MSKNKLYITLILLLTIAFSTKAIANLTLGTTSVTSSGALTLTTNSSTLVLPTTNGTNGQVLTTNGSGVTSWTTVAGGGGVTNSALANVIPKSDGTNLVGSQISDDGTQIRIGGNATLIQVYPSATIIQLGDVDVLSNGTKLGIDDSAQTISLKAQTTDIGNAGADVVFNVGTTGTYVHLDSTVGVQIQTTQTFCAGDCDQNSNATKLTITDNSQRVFLGIGSFDNGLGFEQVNDTNNRFSGFGDVGGIFNGTSIFANDLQSKILLFAGSGIQIWTLGSRPACDTDHRGVWFTTQGDPGVVDKTEQCMKGSNDAYSWVSVVTAP